MSSDQQITCSDCGDVFVFTAAEQAFYEEKGLASPPKRCKACRQARKASARGPGGGPGSGHGGRRPPRYSNDPNEYRSPMQMNDNRYGSSGPRFGSGPERGGPRGGGGGGGERRGYGRNGYGHGHGNESGGGSSEYRSPAFPDQRRASHSQERGDAPKREPRAPRPRPEKPRFDITCAECGAAAQVPFKPIEGRQVFCQACYRARRGTSQEPAETLEVTGSDSGIVE
jgi:CxxC-x17-CxxC domain-containing protein